MAEMQAVEISDRVDRAFQPVRRRHRVRGEHEAVGHSSCRCRRFRARRSRVSRPAQPPRAPDTGQAEAAFSLGRRGNAENALAVKDELVADPAFALQPDAAALLRQFDHLDADVDHVADLDRAEKVQGLRDIDRARARQPHADDAGNQARGVEPVNDPAAEAGLAGEMLGQVDRIVVARQFGEADHVLVLDRLANRRPHAERKILEIERLKERQRQAASRPKVRNGGERRQSVFIVQALQLNRVGGRRRRLPVQRSMNASGDEERVQPRSRRARDVRLHAVADREHAALLERRAPRPLRQRQSACS